MEKNVVRPIHTLSLTKEMCQISGYIDAFDQIQWRAARITNMNENTVNIHYEGWGPSYDENNILINSVKLAPFRAFSRGYTGQTARTYNKFKFIAAEAKKYQKTLEEYLTIGLKNIKETPFTLIQFLRGELFFYIDTMVSTMHSYTPSKSDLKGICEFIESIFRFIIQIISDYPWLTEPGKEYTLRQIYQFPEAAIASSLQEFQNILCALFGVEHKRFAESFKYMEKSLSKEKVLKLDPLQTEKAVLWTARRFYASFMKCKGPETVLKIVGINLEEKNYIYPIFLMYSFLEPFQIIIKHLPEVDFVVAFVTAFSNIILTRLSSIREEDLVEIDSIGLPNFVQRLGLILGEQKGVTSNVKDLIQYS